MKRKPFDVSLKDMTEDYPEAWPELIEAPPNHGVDVVDADISTVSGAADKALLVHGNEFDWILNLEFQAAHKLNLPDRLHLKSTLFRHRHDLPVRSVAVLLRRDANASNLTGKREDCFPGDAVAFDVFLYQVIKVWELPLDKLLSGSLGFLPLAPLTDQAAANLPEVLSRMQARLLHEAPPEKADKLRSIAYILMGLRYPRERIDELFQGVASMEESVTYQAIIEKGIMQGEIQEAQRTLLRLAQKRFGSVDPQIRSAIEALRNLERLDSLVDRIGDVSSWQELLDQN